MAACSRQSTSTACRLKGKSSLGEKVWGGKKKSGPFFGVPVDHGTVQLPVVST
jgi:hypothetical protein